MVFLGSSWRAEYTKRPYASDHPHCENRMHNRRVFHGSSLSYPVTRHRDALWVIIGTLREISAWHCYRITLPSEERGDFCCWVSFSLHYMTAIFSSRAAARFVLLLPRLLMSCQHRDTLFVVSDVPDPFRNRNYGTNKSENLSVSRVIHTPATTN